MGALLEVGAADVFRAEEADVFAVALHDEESGLEVICLSARAEMLEKASWTMRSEDKVC